MIAHRPFIECPFCGENYFGVSTISSQGYTRRCLKCSRPHGGETPYHYPLPKLSKKIIHLDQFVASHIMKALDPDRKDNMDGEVRSSWREFYAKIARLTQGQLILCPYSDVHIDESLMVQYHRKLKRMYEHIGHGTEFKSLHDIQRLQLIQHAEQWLDKEVEYNFEFDPRRIVYGKINDWQDIFYFSFHRNYLVESREEKRQVRDNLGSQLDNIIARWRNEPEKSHNDWFEEESMAFGETVVRKFSELMVDRYLAGRNKKAKLNIFENRPLVLDFAEDMVRLSASKGIGKSQIPEYIMAYFSSHELQKLPFNRIRSMLWAGLAHDVARGGKMKVKSRSVRNDFEVISTLLPYCDAMFVDKECFNLLNREPLKSSIESLARVFSISNRDRFFEYLEEVESSASPEHFEALAEVYGQEWGKPNFQIFDE